MSDSASNASSSALAQIRRRRADNSSSGPVGQARSGSAAGMLKMYSDDYSGLKVDPIVVLVLSLIFIGSVFALHIWSKYVRGI